MNSNTIQYAIVGLGRAGWDIHIDQLRARADAKIVAVVDSLDDRRRQAASEFDCRTYSHISPMLRQNDVDVVIIATPSSYHSSQAIKAMRAGKDVIVEKPMAINLSQADHMIAVAKATGRRLFIHQNYRFTPLARHLVEIVESGTLGTLFHIRAHVSGYFRRSDWQTLVKNGGGVLNNTAPHYIDMILQLAGSPASAVMGDLQRIASAGDAEDHVKAMLRFENGVTADMEISNAQNIAMPQPRWVLCGTHGTLTNDGKNSTIRWYDPSDVSSLEVIDSAAPSREYTNGDHIPWQERSMPVESSQGESFYDNVGNVLRHGGRMRVIPESVREVIRVIAMIRRGTAFTGRTKGQSYRASSRISMVKV